MKLHSQCNRVFCKDGTMENQLELTAAKKRVREDPDYLCSENDSDAENVDVSALQKELLKLRKENQTLKKMLKESSDGRPMAVAAPECLKKQSRTQL